MKNTTPGKGENWSYYGSFDNYGMFERIIGKEYEKIVKVVKSILFQIPNTDIDVLDIGCGTGKLATMLISMIPGKKFIFDYLDRYPEATLQYPMRVPHENQGRGFQGSWEEFSPGKKYNLVIANNSLGSHKFTKSSHSKFLQATKEILGGINV